jgi:energy-coupling factor transporter ATP-binding protein EcfA2
MRNLARTGMTMIVVTHEARFADDVADRDRVPGRGRRRRTSPAGRDLQNRHERTKAFIQRIAARPQPSPTGRSPAGRAHGPTGFLPSTRTTALVHVVWECVCPVPNGDGLNNEYAGLISPPSELTTFAFGKRSAACSQSAPTCKGSAHARPFRSPRSTNPRSGGI